MAAKFPEDTKRQPDHGSHQEIQHLSGMIVDQELIPECEVVFEGEHDPLTTRHRNCPKNPGHQNFIPVSELSQEHIPADLRTRENMDLIQKKIDQTVRVRLKYTSHDRPNVFSDGKAPYPYAHLKGSRKAVRYGTGSLYRIISTQPIKDKSCPCPSCATSDNPETEHWLITVRTATHVVYDDAEANRATFDCFFDSDDTQHVKTLYGLCLDGTNTSQDSMYKSDSAHVICVTHDRETLDKIASVVSSETLQLPHVFSSELPLEGVIVSHPHGCSKRITFGNVLNVTVPIKPVYETCTPIMFQDGTECRVNSPHLAEGGNMLSLESFLQEQPISNAPRIDKPKVKCNKNVAETISSVLNREAFLDSLPSQVTSINDEASKSHQKEHDQRFSGETKEKDACKTISEAFSEFEERFTTSQRASEFKYSSFDYSSLSEATRDLMSQHVPNDYIDKIPSLINAMTHTSQQLSGTELDANNPSHINQHSVDILTNFSDALGLGAETLIPVLDICKKYAPSLNRSSLPNKHVTAVMGMFRDVLKLIWKIEVDSLLDDHDDKGTEAVQSRMDDELCDDDGEWEPDEISDEYVGVMMHTFSRMKPEGLTATQRDLLSIMGLEDTFKKIAKHVVDDDDGDDESDNKSDDSSDSDSDESKLFDGIMSAISESIGLEDILKNVVRLPDDAVNPDTDNCIDVPSGVKFILPSDAEYAMRCHKESPGWFQFPPGTEIANTLGNTMILPEGAAFRHATFHPQHCFINYYIDTCPGSSGAAVYSNLLCNKFMTFYPHSGNSKNCNLSAVQENILLSKTGLLLPNVIELIDALENLPENVEKQLADIDLD